MKSKTLTLIIVVVASIMNLYANDATALKNILPVSDKRAQKSLNGIWKLKVEKGVHPEGEVPAADSSWGEIPVPGCWEQYGFSKASYSFPDSLTGFYRTNFTVPSDWKGNKVVIRLDGVLRGYHLWLNGKHVGQWEECYNTNMMDLTPYLTKNAFKGEPQELAMRIYSRYKGFEFDCWDDWAPMGIYRDVTLMKVPDTYLADLTVTTDDKGNVNVNPVIGNPTKHTLVEATLTDADGNVVGNGCTMKVANPRLWSAETPYLYNLTVTLKDGKKTLQKYDKKIGLRSLRIVDGNQLYLNGSPVKFRGVTYHATDPRTVKVIGDTLTIKDMKLMKEASINYIRTSHYPREPRFYELADSMGFYVVNEVPFGSRGERHLKKEDYYPLLKSRALSTVSRDKNNTCVLIWSLGNENPLPQSCQNLGEYVKSLDSSRLICYPQKGSYFRSVGFEKFPAVADIYAPHYPTTSQLKTFYQNPDRPLIFTEYCHTLGISLEDHDRQWEIIESVPAIAGGSVWEWVDQGMPFTDSLQSRYGYEERVFTSENGGFEMCGNQGTDGILYANRVPLPNYYELQRNYAVVDVIDSVFNGSLTIRNRHDFANLKDNAPISWALVCDNDTVKRGSFSIDCPPRSTATYNFNDKLEANGAVNVLVLDFKNHQGYSILHRNIPVKVDNERMITEVLRGGAEADLTPMIRVGRKPTMCEGLKVADKRIERYIQPLDNPYVKAEVIKNGDKVNYSLSAIADSTRRFFSEVGVAYLLPANIDRVQWIGNGPYASYPGRKRSVSYGIWSMHKDDIYFEGNRMGVDAVWASDRDGNGYMFYCKDGSFNFEQTDKGLILTVNAAVSGEGPKFAPTAFGVWSDTMEPKSGEFIVVKTEGSSSSGIFRNPAEVKEPFTPFLKQYDTYLMRFADISPIP